MAKDEMKREVWIDWMRVLACLMVMIVHSTEPFYLGGDGAQVLTASDGLWASFFDSVVRMCVPLFIIASSYLLFPMHTSTSQFLSRRAVRILIPFVLWSVVYALWNPNPISNLHDLIFNFNYAAGHLWFVYMLIGIYLLIPMLSPWAEQVSRRQLLFFLAIWVFTNIFPILRDWLDPNNLALAYGPTGIPRQAVYPLWGEASWNAYGTFYYLSGFIGYLLLGLYLRRFAPTLSWGRTLLIAIPAELLGFGIVFGGFVRRVWETCGGEFPALGDLHTAVWWETTWTNDTLGVVLMTLAWTLVLRHCNWSGTLYRRVLLPISRASYGMYLCHMIVLGLASAWLRDLWGIGTEGQMGVWTTPVQIVLTALITFCTTAVVCTLLQRIPKVGKYIMG